MVDPYVSALEEAASAWANSLYASPAERIEMAKDLHQYRLFSLNQLAKIVRLTAAGVSRHCKKHDNTGGRFQPEALSLLIYLRKNYLNDGTVNTNLVHEAIKAGCSASGLAKLVGINYPRIYFAHKGRK